MCNNCFRPLYLLQYQGRLPLHIRYVCYFSFWGWFAKLSMPLQQPACAPFKLFDFIFRTMFVVGPKRQLKKMFKPHRFIACCVFLASIVLTLWAGLYVSWFFVCLSSCFCVCVDLSACRAAHPEVLGKLTPEQHKTLARGSSEILHCKV